METTLKLDDDDDVQVAGGVTTSRRPLANVGIDTATADRPLPQGPTAARLCPLECIYVFRNVIISGNTRGPPENPLAPP